ncbi:MAG: adenine deaminase, partial [Chloroflexia bacterium]|nr:adenine deaminase [Chloroflexia bacterium]
LTLYQGRVVARDGRLVDDPVPPAVIPAELRQTMRLAPIGLEDLRLSPADARMAVELIPGQIVTRAVEVRPVIERGWAVSAPGPERDLQKLVCVERHHATGRVGVGYVRGFNLRRGALASSIAHDAHNIVAVGVDDADILAAILAVAEHQGGLAVVEGGRVVTELPLPIAGILSDQPLNDVAAAYAVVEAAARGLGSELDSPFGMLAFLALSVIPEARVTDRGFLHLG